MASKRNSCGCCVAFIVLPALCCGLFLLSMQVDFIAEQFGKMFVTESWCNEQYSDKRTNAKAAKDAGLDWCEDYQEESTATPTNKTSIDWLKQSRNLVNTVPTYFSTIKFVDYFRANYSPDGYWFLANGGVIYCDSRSADYSTLYNCNLAKINGGGIGQSILVVYADSFENLQVSRAIYLAWRQIFRG